MTKVLGNKKSSDGGKNFVVVDAAMNDLIRPSFYQAYHHVLPVRKYITCVIKFISSLFYFMHYYIAHDTILFKNCRKGRMK